MKSRPLPKFPPAVAFAWALCIVLTGCSHGGLDENTVIPRAVGAPVQLDNEQVSLTEAQLNCGIANELWEEAPSGEAQRVIFRLTDKGRALFEALNVVVRRRERHLLAGMTPREVRDAFAVSPKAARESLRR